MMERREVISSLEYEIMVHTVQSERYLRLFNSVKKENLNPFVCLTGVVFYCSDMFVGGVAVDIHLEYLQKMCEFHSTEMHRITAELEILLADTTQQGTGEAHENK